MTTFQVADMTCGHCTSVITKAVKAVDADASVSIDLPSHCVDIESKADSARLSAAITEAGYIPVALAEPRAQPKATRATRGGCCCG